MSRLKQSAIETYQFQTLPDDSHTHPVDLNIPTLELHGEQAIGNTVAKFIVLIPEEVRDPVPVGIVHGWFGTQASYGPLSEWMARNGKPVISIEPNRKLKNGAGFHPAHFFHPERLLSQTVCGAWLGVQSMKEVEKRGVDTSVTDLFAHSMGGRTSIDAATRRPDDVRAIILAAAAGLEPHSVPEFLTERIPAFLTVEVPAAIMEGELQPYLKKAAIEEFIAYTLAGGLRTLKEGISIGSCNIQEKVAALGSTGLVKLAMLEFQADKMIPAERSIRHSGHLVDLAAIHPYRRLGHLAPQTHPQAVGQAVFEMLDALNGTDLSRPPQDPPQDPPIVLPSRSRRIPQKQAA